MQREKERIRREQYPLRVRCQLLRAGMRDRSRVKGIKFDSDIFSVAYLMDRLSRNPNCECCGRLLDISFKPDKKFNESSPSIDRVNPLNGYTKTNVAILCWRCNRIKQDATPQELRMIANFMDCWGNEVESDIELV
jgi:5-methylcytosine-specific restriction endonuclease McrA